MLSLIVARARRGAIGRDGDIPWHAPEDLKFFQRETLGGAIIMGRRTWESLPFKPLKNRLNIVVSRKANLCDHVTGSITEAIAMAERAGHRRIYGIGGAQIYAEMLPLADRLLVTEVDLDVADADAHFPTFDEGQWRQIGHLALREKGPRCVMRELLRA